MPSELQKLGERIRTIAAQCKGWSVAAGKQADRSRATARRARALRERHRGNPVVLDALVAQLDTAARENELTATGLAQLARMLFDFAAWLALPGGPDKAANRPADLLAGSGLPNVPSQAPDSESATDTEAIPAFVEDTARKLPVRTTDGEKTHGYAYDHNGQPIGDGVIESGFRGPGASRDGVDPKQRILYNANFARSHVEGHVAAIMRRNRDLTDVTLVINNVPDDKPLGCQSNLEDMMPRDTTIAVYVTDHDGPWYWGKFIGNGEAVLNE